jgi:tetratricopeptide (TPR) repeat protein
MSVNRNLVLGLSVFTGLGLAIFFLPKAVVNNKTLSTRDSATGAMSDLEAAESHTVDTASAGQIADLKSGFNQARTEKDKIVFLEKLGSAFLNTNRFDSAGVYFERAAAISKDPKLLFKAGNAYFEGMAYTSQASKIEFLARKTRENLEKVPAGDPQSVDAQAKIAMTWVNSETPMKGILKLRELAEKNPENEFLAYQLGLLSFQSGQYDKAVARFETVLKLNKENTNALFYLAQSFLQLGKNKEALEIAEKGLLQAKEEDTKASFEEMKKQLSK